MEKNILVIGYGYLGKGAYRMFSRRYNVFVYDPHMKEYGTEQDTEGVQFVDSPKGDYDLSVICVPTPMKEDGQCDTSIVEESVKETNAEIILIKSTIEPGTSDRLAEKYDKKIVFSPEYMGEGGYHSSYDFHTEMYKTPWIVLGGELEDVRKVHNLMLPIVGPEKKWHYLTHTEAEIVKYMENTYFGTKVSFANEFFNICQALGADFEKVRQAWGEDPRVDIMHTAVFEERRGFGGKCLPKDINAIVHRSREAGYDPKLIDQVLDSNVDFTGHPEFKKV